jgi:hypothetical protein
MVCGQQGPDHLKRLPEPTLPLRHSLGGEKGKPVVHTNPVSVSDLRMN